MPFPDSRTHFNLIPHLARVWRANARAAIIREMEFRANFVSGLLRQVVWLASFILLIRVMFQHTASLAGWTQVQVLTLLALSRIIEGFSDALFNRNISDLPTAVQTGKFDYYLLKPIPAQFHTAFHRFKLLDLGNVLIGLALLAYAVSREPSMFTPGRWLAFAVLALAGIAIYYSVLISLASLSFYFERFEAFFAIDNLLSEPLTAPFDVFPPGVKTALTYLIPLALIVYVPTQALTGRLALWQLPVALLIMIIFLTLANLAWRAGIKRYSSASS
ncbi:MAG: ABC-2 family transporter protein [Candidatus Andersenbacteria bacterium]|nr:ABC-2 family transporter protein [Candidatus Andersenbacteria bacterium]